MPSTGKNVVSLNTSVGTQLHINNLAEGRDSALMRDLIVIEVGRLERYWLDLWRYRELFRVLAWRGLSVRDAV
jgi:hypothetical protein